MNKKQIKWRNRILIAIALFFAVMIAEKTGALAALFGEAEVYAAFVLYFVAFLIAGHDVLVKAWNNIRRGDPLRRFSSPRRSRSLPRAARSCSSIRWASFSRAMP